MHLSMSSPSGGGGRVCWATHGNLTSVCPVIDHEFCRNMFKIAMNSRGNSRVDPQTTLIML